MAESSSTRWRNPRQRMYREAARRLVYPIILIFVTIWIGVAGYMAVEGWNFLDSLYMTMITMTTIGYGETHPLDPAGRIFTIGLMVITIMTAGYALSTLATFVFAGELNRILRGRRMDSRISKLKDHIIICGAGRTGVAIADEFSKTRTPFVLIESDEHRLQYALEIHDLPYIQADATHDETLRLAGIERARGLISTLGEDKDNLFIVLSARSLNPTLRIIARVSDDENAAKLRRAGADEVVLPNQIGGLRMASVMIRPTVVTFLDEMLRLPGEALRVSEVYVKDAPSLIGKTLGDAAIPERTGLLVVAIYSNKTDYQFSPAATTVMHETDTLIVMGTISQREAFDSIH